MPCSSLPRSYLRGTVVSLYRCPPDVFLHQTAHRICHPCIEIGNGHNCTICIDPILLLRLPVYKSSLRKSCDIISRHCKRISILSYGTEVDSGRPTPRRKPISSTELSLSYSPSLIQKERHQHMSSTKMHRVHHCFLPFTTVYLVLARFPFLYSLSPPMLTKKLSILVFGIEASAKTKFSSIPFAERCLCDRNCLRRAFDEVLLDTLLRNAFCDALFSRLTTHPKHSKSIYRTMDYLLTLIPSEQLVTCNSSYHFCSFSFQIPVCNRSFCDRFQIQYALLTRSGVFECILKGSALSLSPEDMTSSQFGSEAPVSVMYL